MSVRSVFEIRSAVEGPPRARVESPAQHAIPNRRIVQLGDDVLGCGGALVDAVERMGEPSLWVDEAPLTKIRL